MNRTSKIKIDFTLQVPDKYLIKVLSYLSVFDICRSKRVSRRWRNLIENDKRMFFEVDIQKIPNTVQLFSVLKIFSRDKVIKSIKLPPQASQTDISYLVMQLPQGIEELTLNNINMEFSKIFVREFPKLRSFTLVNETKANKKVFDEIELKSLLTLKSTQSLKLISIPFDNSFFNLQIFSQFQLRELTILDAPQLNNQSLYLISKLPFIISLSIGGSANNYNQNITKEGFSINMKLLNLELHYISHIGDQTIRIITEQFTQLTSFVIVRNNYEQCSHIGDNSLKYLASLHLYRLSIIYNRKFKEEAAQHLAKMTNLKYLSLRDCPLQLDLSPLIACKNLEEVDFSGDTWVTKQQVNGLAKCNIKILRLGHFEHGDQDCDTKLQLYPPEGLFLEAVFKDQRNFINLHTLYLERNCNLTYWLYSRIKKIRPQLFIK